MTDKKDNITNIELLRQRRASLEFIKITEKYAVKAIAGQKEPVRGWDPKNNNRDRSDAIVKNALDTDENIGIHLFGDIADVDIDSDNPHLTAALDLLLPPCAHVWGRPSRPRTHRVYRLRDDDFDPSNYPVLNRLKRIEEAKVEIRGGRQTRGEYSLLPSSIHPSGEMYEWSDASSVGSSLSITTPERLIRAIRLAGAIAVLAPFWVEGVRNEMTLALSGLLFRMASISESFNDESTLFSKEESRNFLKALIEVAGDDPTDIPARLKTFEATWRKAELGHKVTGGATLKSIVADDKIVRKLFILMTDNPGIEKIDAFLQRFAVWVGPGMAVDLNAVARGETKPFMSREAFINSYGHYKIMINGKSLLLPAMLFAMDNAIRVDGLTFEPKEPMLVEESDGRILANQWAGFKIEPYKDPVGDEGIPDFLEYLREIVSDNDPGKLRWVTAWIADIFQRPERKPGTALVLVGPPGAGKSFLGHSVLGPIIGRAHYVPTNNIDNVTRDFNIMFDNKLLIQCDEAMNTRQRSQASKLKALITDAMIKVEPKGIDPYIKPSVSRFLLTSNLENDAVNVMDGAADRRYVIMKVSDAKRNDKQYWSRMHALFSDEEYSSKVLRWLLDYKYDSKEPLQVFNTLEKQRTAEHSMDAMGAWLLTIASRGHPLSEDVHESWVDAPLGKLMPSMVDRTEWPTYLSKTAAAKDFTEFLRSRRDLGPVSASVMSIGLHLKHLGLVEDASEDFRASVTAFDQKTGKSKRKFVMCWKLVDYDTFVDNVNAFYGSAVEKFEWVIDRTYDDTPESQQF